MLEVCNFNTHFINIVNEHRKSDVSAQCALIKSATIV